MSQLKTLGEVLTLERIDEDRFRGASLEGGPPRIYGGQVVAQAMMAMNATIDRWPCHSQHCYYVRPGDPAVPLDFVVERVRDGGSFATRHVSVMQADKQICTLIGSFQAPEAGLDRQREMPKAPPLEGMADRGRGASGLQGALDVRLADEFVTPDAGPPVYHAWMRARAPLGDDQRLHQAVLAFGSDWALLGAAMRPHGVHWRTPGMQAASLDHTVWFHRATDFNRWHLFTLDSPWAGSGRGLVLGALYREDGTLVASFAQEGLIRVRAPKPE